MSSQMIEIFLFVDPLGRRCNNVRKTINEFKNEHQEKIKLRIIPVVNFKKVYGRTRKTTNTEHESFVELNNHFSTNTYQASLAFHAGAMQGRRKAHDFLNVLQETVVEEGIDFSEDLMMEIAKEVNFDLEMFEEDYKSDLVKKIYHKNLRLASQMKVTGTPSCVIYKHHTKEKAVRLKQKIEYEILSEVCGCNTDEKPINNQEIKREKFIQEKAQKVAQLNIL